MVCEASYALLSLVSRSLGVIHPFSLFMVPYTVSINVLPYVNDIIIIVTGI
jgi:hypothetical protein